MNEITKNKITNENITTRKRLGSRLWKKAQDTINALYGDMPDVRILNRFYSEKMLFENTDYIIMWDLVAELRLRAKENNCLTKLAGTDTAAFSAFLLGATETNPLPLHYLCPVCKRTEFAEERALPWDMPDKPCNCGAMMRLDGFNIPKEMCISRNLGPWPHLSVSSDFIGFAEKIIREKTAGLYKICKLTKPEYPILRLVFLPFDTGADCEENIDTVDDKYNSYPQITIVPTVIYDNAQKLSETTKIDFAEIMTDISERLFSDSRIMSAFRNGDIGGIPGFDSHRLSLTNELREALTTVSPRNYYELLKYLGAMHGTGTWWDNTELLVKNKACEIGDIPSHRDDVFMLIRDKLVESGHTDVGIAHNVATRVRLGVYARSGICAEDNSLIEYLNLPNWFIPYVEKIEYMSSKANSISVLRTALTFMWYKVNCPEAFSECIESRL